MWRSGFVPWDLVALIVMEETTKKKLTKEWIILALCLGLGAHVTLGLVLHGGEAARTETYGLYGILISVSIYVLVQLGRSVWWLLRGERSEQETLE